MCLHVYEFDVFQGAYTLVNARSGTFITYSAPGWATTMCGMGQERTGVLNNGWKPPWLPFLDYNHTVSPVTGSDWPMPCSFQVSHHVKCIKCMNQYIFLRIFSQHSRLNWWDRGWGVGVGVMRGEVPICTGRDPLKLHRIATYLYITIPSK